MSFTIEPKEDSPEKLAAIAGKPTKYYLFAEELMQLIDYVNALDLQQITEVGAQTNLSMTIRNDALDRFLAVAKGSKDLQMYADRLSHTSNGESSTQIVFAPTLTGAEIQVRNLSGTMALLSDLTAVLEGIAWKQPVELNLHSGVSLSGSIPTITSLTQQGVTLVDDSRVIVSGLVNQIFNGIYRVNSTLVGGTYRLYRTNDANTTAELNNAVVGVTGGTHAGKTFRQSTLNPVIGTSNIVFQDFGSAVANATNLVAGISKLYNAIGTETDGGITPNAVKEGLELKSDIIFSDGVTAQSIAVTTEQKLKSYLIPANRIADGSNLLLNVRFVKTGGGGALHTLRVYVNTSDTLVGATLIGIFSFSVTTPQELGFQRNITIKGSNLSVLNTSVSATNDLVTSNTTPSSIAFNRAVNQYLIISVQSAAGHILQITMANLIKN